MGKVTLERTRGIVDLLGLLHRKPRTCEELMNLSGAGMSTVRRWVKALEEEGMVYRLAEQRHDHGARGKGATVYAWKHLPTASAWEGVRPAGEARVQ